MWHRAAEAGSRTADALLFESKQKWCRLWAKWLLSLISPPSMTRQRGTRPCGLLSTLSRNSSALASLPLQDLLVTAELMGTIETAPPLSRSELRQPGRHQAVCWCLTINLWRPSVRQQRILVQVHGARTMRSVSSWSGWRKWSYAAWLERVEASRSVRQ